MLPVLASVSFAPSKNGNEMPASPSGRLRTSDRDAPCQTTTKVGPE